LRADIDYGTAEAKTTYGRIGVKVWIYKGEVLPQAPKGEGRPDFRAEARPDGFAEGKRPPRRPPVKKDVAAPAEGSDK
jgi:small subunit ribosomal protein S3